MYAEKLNSCNLLGGGGHVGNLKPSQHLELVISVKKKKKFIQFPKLPDIA